jgi:hypothetical protein
MARGILDTVGLAATLIFAIPLAYAGVDYALKGDLLVGGVLVALGVLMVVLKESLTTPGDIPGLVAKKTVGRVVKEPDADADEE